MQIAGLTDAFDRGNFVAFVHQGEGETAVDATAVDVDRAGAALSVVAALFGTGEVKALAEGIEQRGTRVEITQRIVFAIDAQRDVVRAGCLGLVLDCGLKGRCGSGQRSGTSENTGSSQTGKK